jgi:ribose/xylose/arabinose/galactoside ABC-type transport system permease subunit
VIVIGVGWAVARTRFFRQFYFIGGNPKAAKLSGIRVDRLTRSASSSWGCSPGSPACSAPRG